MTLRTTQKTTAETVLAHAAHRGITPHTIAEATGLNEHEINARLHGDAPFTVSELVQVGGLLSVSPTDLIGDEQ